MLPDARDVDVLGADHVILEHASRCRSTATISNSHPFLQVLIIVILVTAIWSALYLNKCMMCFGNTQVHATSAQFRRHSGANSGAILRRAPSVSPPQVVPFYYCTFTTLSILGGGVVYKEFDAMTWQQGLMFGFGIVLAFSGVYLICANRKEAKEFNELPPEEKLGRIQSTGGLQPVGPLVGSRRVPSRRA